MANNITREAYLTTLEKVYIEGRQKVTFEDLTKFCPHLSHYQREMIWTNKKLHDAALFAVPPTLISNTFHLLRLSSLNILEYESCGSIKAVNFSEEAMSYAKKNWSLKEDDAQEAITVFLQKPLKPQSTTPLNAIYQGSQRVAILYCTIKTRWEEVEKRSKELVKNQTQSSDQYVPQVWDQVLDRITFHPIEGRELNGVRVKAQGGSFDIPQTTRSYCSQCGEGLGLQECACKIHTLPPTQFCRGTLPPSILQVFKQKGFF